MYEASAATRFLKRSKWLTIGVRIARDRRAGLADRFGRGEKRTMGATHRAFDIDQSVEYVESVFSDYLQFGKLAAADIDDARVLELGPGDNFGVALLFLGAGARTVVGVDRFRTWRDPEQQREIYRALLERMVPAQRQRAAAMVDLDAPEGPRFDPERLRVVEGLPIEEAPAALGEEGFDMVVSRAVMEHVFDARRALDAIDRLLVPGGRSIHKIDYEDHGLFTTGGLHPLTYLTVPDRIYGWMGANSGLPNRCLNDFWAERTAGMGYEWELLSTRLIGEEGELVPHTADPPADRLAKATALAEEIQPQLLPRYRALPLETLAVSGAFLSSTKPGPGAGG